MTLKDRNTNAQLWTESAHAQCFFESEKRVLESALRQTAGPTTLQVGTVIDQSALAELDLPYLLKASRRAGVDAHLLADPAFLPFQPKSLTTVVLPHVLEGHQLPHQVLREAHRVLVPEGHLVLTGFNPISLLGLQRAARRKAVFPGRYYTSARVIDWLQLLGFEVVASSMFQYAPIVRNERVRRGLQFLEAVGDRWLPMTGGGYMIAARKRDAGMTLIGRLQFKSPKRKLVAAARTKTSIKDS